MQNIINIVETVEDKQAALPSIEQEATEPLVEQNRADIEIRL